MISSVNLEYKLNKDSSVVSNTKKVDFNISFYSPTGRPTGKFIFILYIAKTLAAVAQEPRYASLDASNSVLDTITLDVQNGTEYKYNIIYVSDTSSELLKEANITFDYYTANSSFSLIEDGDVNAITYIPNVDTVVTGSVMFGELANTLNSLKYNESSNSTKYKIDPICCTRQPLNKLSALKINDVELTGNVTVHLGEDIVLQHVEDAITDVVPFATALMTLSNEAYLGTNVTVTQHLAELSNLSVPEEPTGITHIGSTKPDANGKITINFSSDFTVASMMDASSDSYVRTEEEFSNSLNRYYVTLDGFNLTASCAEGTVASPVLLCEIDTTCACSVCSSSSSSSSSSDSSSSSSSSSNVLDSTTCASLSAGATYYRYPTDGSVPVWYEIDGIVTVEYRNIAVFVKDAETSECTCTLENMTQVIASYAFADITDTQTSVRISNNNDITVIQLTYGTSEGRTPSQAQFTDLNGKRQNLSINPA